MVHPDQAGRLWPPCGPLHYASPLNSTQPKFVELVQQAQTQCNWLRCWAIENGLAAVPCPVAAAAASAQRQRVREDRPPQLPGQAAASSQVPSNFRRPPAQYSRASVDQTEDAAAAQQACGRTAESQTEGQAGGANYDHTYLAERLRQHQPAWQPTNGYGYDYDPWHVPEPRQARPRDLFSSPPVFPSAPPSFPTPAASPCAPAAPAQQQPTSFFFTQTPAEPQPPPFETKAKAPCVQPTHLPTKAPPPCVLRQIPPGAVMKSPPPKPTSARRADERSCAQHDPPVGESSDFVNVTTKDYMMINMTSRDLTETTAFYCTAARLS